MKVASKTGSLDEIHSKRGTEVKKLFEDYQEKNLKCLELHETSLLLLQGMYNKLLDDWNHDETESAEIAKLKRKFNGRSKD